MNEHGTCLYRVLGVPKDATQEEIKAAFRKLSKETHPDVAGATTNIERFKRISHAASVLTNVRHRQEYDNRRHRFSTSFAANHTSFHRDVRPPPRYHDGRQGKGFTGVLLTMFRPRNMVLGPLAVFATVSAIQYALGIENDKQQRRRLVDDDRVQAWRNPVTGRWETPAPWDPNYQRLKPTLEFVPRKEVWTRHR